MSPTLPGWNQLHPLCHGYITFQEKELRRKISWGKQAFLPDYSLLRSDSSYLPFILLDKSYLLPPSWPENVLWSLPIILNSYGMLDTSLGKWARFPKPWTVIFLFRWCDSCWQNYSGRDLIEFVAVWMKYIGGRRVLGEKVKMEKGSQHRGRTRRLLCKQEF